MFSEITPIGEKFDDGKLRHTLFPPEAMEEILKVLEFGAKKYSPDNWKHVDDAEGRYLNAALRHITEYRKHQHMDSESGHATLAHAACCLVFLLQLSLEGAGNEET